MIGRLRTRLSYANVMASVAVFIALGGTSYALTLPRNSVGSRQIKPHSVRTSDIRSKAIRSRQVRNRSLTLFDLAPASREALRGQQGPPGPPGPATVAYSAAVNSAGSVASGNGVPGTHISGTGTYEVSFGRDMSSCRAMATLSRVPGGGTVDPPPGRITTATSSTGVTVRTYDQAGAIADLPFHLLAVC